MSPWTRTQPRHGTGSAAAEDEQVTVMLFRESGQRWAGQS